MHQRYEAEPQLLLLLSELEKAEGRLVARGDVESALEIALQVVDLRFSLFGATQRSKEYLLECVLTLTDSAAQLIAGAAEASDAAAAAQAELVRADAALQLLHGKQMDSDDAIDVDLVAARAAVLTHKAICFLHSGDSSTAVRLLQRAIALGDGTNSTAHLYLSRELGTLAATASDAADGSAATAATVDALRHARLAAFHCQEELLSMAVDFDDDDLRGFSPDTLFRTADASTLYEGGRADRSEGAELAHSQVSLLSMAYHNLGVALERSERRGEREAAVQWYRHAERLANGCARAGGVGAQLAVVLEHIRETHAQSLTPALRRRGEESRASIEAIFTQRSPAGGGRDGEA